MRSAVRPTGASSSIARAMEGKVSKRCVKGCRRNTPTIWSIATDSISMRRVTGSLLDRPPGPYGSAKMAASPGKRSRRICLRSTPYALRSHKIGSRLFYAPSRFVGGIAGIRTQSTFIAINLVAVEARIGDDTADIADRLLISGLRCLISSLARFCELHTELDPFRIIDRNRFAVLAPASRGQHKRRG